MARPSGPMPAEQRSRMGETRQQAIVVRRYLDFLRQQKPTPGKRRKTLDTLEADLAAVDEKLLASEDDSLERLTLLQRRIELLREREEATARDNAVQLEERFVTAAKPYGERYRISYAAWREFGVKADLLARAGISTKETATAPSLNGDSAPHSELSDY